MSFIFLSLFVSLLLAVPKLHAHFIYYSTNFQRLTASTEAAVAVSTPTLVHTRLLLLFLEKN